MTFPRARSAADEVFVQDCVDEIVVYDVRRDEGHLLNQTAGLVFRHCDGKTSPAQLSVLVAERFELEAEEASHLVWMSLDLLEKADLLTGKVAKDFKIDWKKFLKRASVAAAVLPLVYSMTMPTAAAQLSAPMGACCTGAVCVFDTESSCEQLGGSYQGDGVWCSATDPGPVTELVDGPINSQMSLCECIAAGGCFCSEPGWQPGVGWCATSQIQCQLNSNGGFCWTPP